MSIDIDKVKHEVDKVKEAKQAEQDRYTAESDERSNTDWNIAISGFDQWFEDVLVSCAKLGKLNHDKHVQLSVKFSENPYPNMSIFIEDAVRDTYSFVRGYNVASLGTKESNIKIKHVLSIINGCIKDSKIKCEIKFVIGDDYGWVESFDELLDWVEDETEIFVGWTLNI